MNLMEERTNVMIGGIWVTTEQHGLLYRLIPSFVSLREDSPPTK